VVTFDFEPFGFLLVNIEYSNIICYGNRWFENITGGAKGNPEPGSERNESMDSKYERANSWSNVVIGAAIEVHRLKGPGLLESIYDKCLCRELQLREVPAVGQMQVEIDDKGFTFFEPLKLDLFLTFRKFQADEVGVALPAPDDLCLCP
jgi:PD-(D/E)XK nuclease superfamily